MKCRSATWWSTPMSARKRTPCIPISFRAGGIARKGVAGEFMRQLMDVVRAEELQAVPVCGLPKTCCNNSALEAQSARNSLCASTNLQ
jgi:hypothetical protein